MRRIARAVGVAITVAVLAPSATVASTPLAAEQATAPGSPLVSPVAGLVAAFVVAALVGVAVTLLLSGRRESVRERVALFTEADDEEDGEGPNEGGLARLADRWLSGASWWRRFHLDYEIANFGWTPGRTVMAGLAGALTLGALLAASTSLPLLILAPTVLVPPIVWMIVRFRAVRERRRFAEQLADHLAVVAGALRAGLSLSGAMTAVVDDAPEPTRREFRRVATDVELGAPLDEALERIAVRMRSRDMEQVATVAELQRESGTNAAETLEQVIRTVREREELRRLVRTLTAQGRLTRWILSMLPAMVLVVLLLLNPTFVEPLFTTTLGLVLIGVGLGMITVGSLIIKRIVEFEV